MTARGGNGDALTYSLSGSGAFTIDAATGQIRVATGAVLDHETTQSHTVTVSVTDGAGTDGAATATADVTITVTDVNEPPARPDAPSVSPSPDAPRTALDVTWTAPANTGPPLTGYDVRYREQGAQAWSSHAVTGTVTSTTIAGLDSGATYEVQVAASNDEGTSDWSDSGTGSTEPENANSGGPLSAVRSVAENTAAGTAVGAPIDVAAPADATLTYSLSGSSDFTIDAAGGQIRVATGAALDHESRQSYSVTVSVTGGTSSPDAQPGAAATVAVTIRVTDVDEAPPRPDAPSVVRSSSSPTSELDVTWTAPDMTGRPPITAYDIGYREADGGGWTEWSLDASRTSTTITGLQAETTYHVRIRARNDEGESPWSDPGQGSTEAQAPAPQEPDQPEQPDQPDAPDQPDTPAQPDTPTRTVTPAQPDTPSGPDTPSQPETPGIPDVPLGPGGPVTPGPGEPGTALGPNGPGAPITPNPDAEPPSGGANEAGQPVVGVGAASGAGAGASAAGGTVAEGASAGPAAGLLTVLGPVDRAAAGAAGVGTLALVALLAGLHALLGGLTKPLGLGTALLIPLLVPARRRRKKQAAEETPDTTATPASAPAPPRIRRRAPWERHGRAEPRHRNTPRSRTTRPSARESRDEQ